eukprot:m.656790 g.656790  ORF g.656790 m.656790 type:complete len:505 (+) comp22707_c0_seq1:374-1888(+)
MHTSSVKPFILGVCTTLFAVWLVSPHGNGGAIKKTSILRRQTPEATDDGGAHSPTGKHLILDMYDINGDILNNEQHLRDVSIKLVRDIGMTMLSIQSHKLEPQGVSITVTLSESHFTIHTWPEHGVALVDLFTCGRTDILPNIGKVASSFGGDLQHAKWALHPRGAQQLSDVESYVTSNQHFSKQLLYQGRSQYQAIEVWQSTDPKESPTTANLLFLDGVLQSSTADEHVYHESLVHPAMFAHPTGAQRVAVLGGGEGATVRELLKYKSIDEVVMVELDRGVIDASLQFLPQMNDCGFGARGAYKNCFNDSRVRLVVGDAFQWFSSQFPDTACDTASEVDKFDVIVLDLLDPELSPDSDFARHLYSKEMMGSLACALRHNGVFVVQLGRSPEPGNVEDIARLRFKTNIIDTIGKHYHEHGTFVYDSYVPSYHGKWTFVLGCRTAACVEKFTEKDAAKVQAAMHAPLVSGATFKYLDARVMQSLQHEPRSYTELFSGAEVRRQLV